MTKNGQSANCVTGRMNLERETGLEPATLSLGTDEETEEPPLLTLS